MSHLLKAPTSVAVLAVTFGIGLVGCSSDTVNDATDAASSAVGEASSAGAAAATDASSAAGKASTAVAGAASSASAGVKSYTMTQVKGHGTTSSCWAVVKNDVYDLTKWIAKHPGGPDNIKQLCGTDATSKFEAQHESEAKPNQQIASFKIGSLEG